jgi:hypothetical protein
MNRKLLSKIISLGILAACQGLYAHADYASDSQMGRNGFMAKEAARWDRHMAHPHPIPFYIIEWLLLFGILFAVYEFFAFVAIKFMKTGSKPATVKA